MPSLSPYSSALDYSYAPGFYPSMECLKHRPEQVRRLLLHSSAAGREGADKLRALAEALNIRVEEADRALSRVSGKENCFAAAVFGKFQDHLDPAKPHVVLHQPGDSGNVGTILRTALAFGMEDLALIRPCVDLFDPKVLQSCPPLPFTLVFGNEGSGLPPEFARYGQPVRIESNDRVDSLNLAIAVGIAIYGFAKLFFTPES